MLPGIRAISALLTAVFVMSAMASFAPPADRVIPTLNCMSLEWNRADGGPAKPCGVQYRAKGATTWKTGHPLWWDRVEKQYRGSVVDLADGTAYEFQLSLPGGISSTLHGTTWSSNLKIAETVTLPAGTLSDAYVITNGVVSALMAAWRFQTDANGHFST